MLELDAENQDIVQIKMLNENGNMINIRDIAKNDKLVFRYSEMNCNVCVDSQLVVLKQLCELIGENKIIIITTYVNALNMAKFKRINQIKPPIYNLIGEGLGLQIDSLNMPFYFTLTKDGIITNVFIPEKEYPKSTQLYIKTIERYFNGNLCEEEKMLSYSSNK